MKNCRILDPNQNIRNKTIKILRKNKKSHWFVFTPFLITHTACNGKYVFWGYLCSLPSGEPNIESATAHPAQCKPSFDEPIIIYEKTMTSYFLKK